jgi:hypothetical protein
MPSLLSFLRPPFQISKRAAGELIGRQLGNRLGDFFELHVVHREALDVGAGGTGLATVVADS